MHQINRKIPPKVEVDLPIVNLTEPRQLPDGNFARVTVSHAPFVAKINDFSIESLQESGIPLTDIQSAYIHSSLGAGIDNLNAAATKFESLDTDNTDE